MRDFYASGAMPFDDAVSMAQADQAQGLRRLFAGAATRHVALVANPHVAFTGVALERLAAALALQGRRTLIVDAAEQSPPPPESAAFDLAAAVETLSPGIAYLPARGLPLAYVNTRGSSARLLDDLAAAAPRADTVLVHAGAADLARLFTRRALRPMLLAADHPESVKHAYASMKLLAQRCAWMSADLLIVAGAQSPRTRHIAGSMARCADLFIGAALTGWAAVDPSSEPTSVPDAALRRLVAAQLQPADDAGPVPAALAAMHAAPHTRMTSRATRAPAH
jgi:hypothetical protein